MAIFRRARKFPGISENFGKALNPFLRSLKIYENFGKSLAIFGNFWKTSATVKNLQKSLGVFGNFRKTSETVQKWRVENFFAQHFFSHWPLFLFTVKAVQEIFFSNLPLLLKVKWSAPFYFFKFSENLR